jgi:tetratricopeptide (TPR) repeat protein
MKRIFLALLLLLSLSLPAHALPKEGDEWIRLDTPSFTFFSNATERTTHRIAANIERLRSVLIQLNPDIKATSDRPTFVYIFRNAPALTPYKPIRNGKRIDVDGLFVALNEANYMAFHAEMSTDTTALVYHEYLHDLLRNNYSSLPLWFEEGLAEFYSTFKANDQFAEIGHASPDHIRWLRENNLIPLAQLFAMDQSSKTYNEGYERGVFYSESWALVHYLMMGNEARRAQALQYFHELASGVPGPEAFRRAFNTGEATLEKELRDYVRRSLFNYARFPVEPEAKLQAKVVPLPRHELLTRLGDLLASEGPEQSAAAAEHFRAALAAKPDAGAAMAGLARLEEAAGRHEESRALRDKAVQLAPDDFSLQLRSAADLLAQGKDPATLEKARAALTRAVQIRPDSGEAWAALAETYNAATRSDADPLPPQAVTAYENAHRLRPRDFAAAYNLVLVYARTGQRDKAAELIEKEIAPVASADQLRIAWEGWIGEGRVEAEDLIQQKKLDEAAVVLEALKRRAPADLSRPLADRLAEIKRVTDLNRFAARYNEAVALLQQKKTDEAYAILTDLAANTPDPQRAATARELADQVAAMRKAQKPPAKKKKG